MFLHKDTQGAILEYCVLHFFTIIKALPRGSILDYGSGTLQVRKYYMTLSSHYLAKYFCSLRTYLHRVQALFAKNCFEGSSIEMIRYRIKSLDTSC